MKKAIPAIIMLFTLSGCATLDTVRTNNRSNLMKLSVGMPKADALQAMGTNTIIGEMGISINNPYRSETMKGKDDKNYEVLYYYTDLKRADNAITDDELTPIILQDGKVVGWGWSYLQDNVSKYEVRVR